MTTVECAYQGSKYFSKGGPYHDLYNVSSRDAKLDKRLQNSGDFLGYNFFGMDFPSKPVTLFYDWLYLTALNQNTQFHIQLFNYNAFSDIVFNHYKSLNCQARSAALFIALNHNQYIHKVLNDLDFYLSLNLSATKDNNNFTDDYLQLKLPF